MTTKQVRPEGANWLTPYLTVGDAEASLAFYEKAFGFKRGNTIPGSDGSIVHAEMTYQGTTIIMFAPEGAWGGTARTPAHSRAEPPIGLYIYCDDVDMLAVQAKKADVTILAEAEDMFWGDRIVRMRDPDGYAWTFATKVGKFDPNKIPLM